MIDYDKYKGHTEGPWLLSCNVTNIITNWRDKNGNMTADNSTKNGWAKTVCKLSHQAFAGMGEHYANGLLIADAPALLNRCLELEEEKAVMLEALENLENDNGEMMPPSAWGLVQAAINKAKGGSK